MLKLDFHNFRPYDYIRSQNIFIGPSAVRQKCDFRVPQGDADYAPILIINPLEVLFDLQNDYVFHTSNLCSCLSWLPSGLMTTVYVKVHISVCMCEVL